MITIATKKIGKVMLNDWSYFLQKTTLAMCKKRELFFLTSRGIETNQLLERLTAPAKSVEKTFNDILSLMTNHENLKKNPTVDRFQFNKHNRKTGESVSQYTVEPRRVCQY